MNFIIHIAPKPNTLFLKDAQRLIKADDSEVKQIKLSIPSVVSELVMAGGSDSAAVDPGNRSFSEQFKAFLPTDQNESNKKSLVVKVKNWVGDSKIFNGKASLESRFDEKEMSPDLLVFDVNELTTFPHVLPSLFLVLEARPCSVLFLNSGSVGLKKIVIKYSGKDNSIYSMYSFTSLFPQIAKEAEDSVFISPFTFKKSQLAMERKVVNNIKCHYGALGFIKLPFIEVNDYYYYAVKVKADLLVFPKSDLKEIQKLIFEKSKEAAISPFGLSFFVG